MSNITKAALGNSLKNILKNKPLDKVTISDITNDCGVNRMTFYYHFQDIYDLVEWVCVNDAEKALDGKQIYDNWQEGMLNILNLMLENKNFVLNVYHSVSREYLDKYVYRLTGALFLDVVTKLCEGKDISEEDKKFIAEFYRYAFVGIVFQWIDENMKEDPKKIIQKLDIITSGDIAGVVNRFEEKKNKENL